MTRDEVLKIIFVIKTTYPEIYSKFSAEDFKGMTDVWEAVLSGFPYQRISLGLQAYLTSDISGFPPKPAQLIRLSQKGKNVLSSNEAWALVFKAICNSGYNSEEEFAKLPELCQKAIGSAASLKELSQMDIKTVQSVEGSHFKRNYETLQKREEEYLKIPENVRLNIEALDQKLLEADE